MFFIVISFVLVCLFLFFLSYSIWEKKSQSVGEKWEASLRQVANDLGFRGTLIIRDGGESTCLDKTTIILSKQFRKGVIDIETMMIILAHEIAHTLCGEIHHTEKYQLIQLSLLKKLIEKGYLTQRRMEEILQTLVVA